jgi:mannose-1-phosphate guanylyltransferase
MKKCAVILAGGSGKRLWPLSNQKHPKQVLNLYNDKSLINNTIDRIKDYFELENIFIITNKSQGNIIKENINIDIKSENFLLEPLSRNTAACIAYASMEIKKRYTEAVMCIFSIDHYIEDEVKFIKTLDIACKNAIKNNNLITIGIKATFPSTQFGYIKYSGKGQIKDVIEYIEKPNLLIAKEYIEKGYIWNSGIFIFKTSVILQKFKEFLPNIYKKIQKAYKDDKKDFDKLYSEIESISIDHGIFEKNSSTKVIEGDFGWVDIGNFDTLSLVLKKDISDNSFVGEHREYNSQNCTVFSKDKKIYLVGVKDLIIIENEDTVMICSKKNISDIKKIQ